MCDKVTSHMIGQIFKLQDPGIWNAHYPLAVSDIKSPVAVSTQPEVYWLLVIPAVSTQPAAQWHDYPYTPTFGYTIFKLWQHSKTIDMNCSVSYYFVLYNTLILQSSIFVPNLFQFFSNFPLTSPLPSKFYLKPRPKPIALDPYP